jgi:hypothetical protein
MSDEVGAASVKPQRRWLLFAVGGCVVFVAVVIGVAMWGGASSTDACVASGDAEGEGQPMCTVNDYLESSSIVLRGTLSAMPMDDTSQVPVETRTTGDVNDIQPDEIAWHSFTPTQVLYADPRLEYRGQQVPTVGSAMPFGVPLETSGQLATGSTGDDVADVVVFGTWLGTDLIAGYHVVGPPPGILSAGPSMPHSDEPPFLNARLIANDDADLWLTEIADFSNSRTALLRDELEDCLADPDLAAQQAC